MDKELINQVQIALQAQQDTIDRQRRMLDEKDRDIAHLQSLLEQLAKTQIEQLENLPTLNEQLIGTISEQKKIYSSWLDRTNKLLSSVQSLGNETMQLCNAQISLTRLLKEYQGMLVPDISLKSDMELLEGKLNALQMSQCKIEESQQLIENELNNLNKLTRR